MVRLLSSALLVVAMVAFGAMAQAANLTAKQITGSVAAMPEMGKLGKKYKLDDVKNRPSRTVSTNFEKEFSDGMKKLHASGGYGEASAIARKHGFSSPEQWAGVTARVMRAYLALTIGPRLQASRAQMKQSMAMIQNNPQISPDQKKQIMAQMQAGSRMMDELEKVPAADKAAVKPHMKALKDMMNSMADAEMGGGMRGGMGGMHR